IGNATGYSLTVGTTAGGSDILNAQDVGNVTTFDLPTNLPDETTIYVSVTPYNSAGNATACTEESFTTEVIPPLCTTLSSPINGATDVSIATDLTWNAIGNATGYLLTVGTTAGGSDILNAQDVGNVTTFDFATDLPGLTEIFVSITPYNSVGNALNCNEYSFITELPLPGCSNLISPLYQETNVPLNTNLTWTASEFAAGYIVSIGTSTGASDIVMPTDVGNVTTFNPPIDFPNFTEIFVTIEAYNASGSTVCGDDQFTTEDLTPVCVNLVIPYNGDTDVALFTNITWEADANAEGYLLTMGTTSGGNDLVNAVDVGNFTTYDYFGDLPQNTEIFVTVTPYNFLGEAIGCTEQSFTTVLFAPQCTSLTQPLNGESEVSISTNLSWLPSDLAEGYLVSVGTTAGGIDILNTQDVGNVTTYDFLTDLPDDTTIFVSIIPYNATGNATNCMEYSFTTEVVIPECTVLNSPFNNETAVAVDAILTWDAVQNTTGYTITIATTPNGNDIIDTLDVGDVTFYQPLSNFIDNTTYYVTITAYNSAGNAQSCAISEFITENRAISTPAFFTPNGDAFNQKWIVEDPKREIKLIHIFDRYGKLIKSFTNTTEGWDGTYRGSNLPTDDYWFVLELFNGTTQKGHFTLKR
ncbi:T9SS type B sorting domain-containing protein, partial [Lacinutrix salivirga]